MNQGLMIEIIKNRVSIGLNEDFTGIGIIIVNDDASNLPIAPLVDNFDTIERYCDEDSIVEFLFRVSRKDDKFHDGFHVVSNKLGLIKASQFFSPPIPMEFKHTVFNVGSRQRAAQYGSLCEGVSSIITISHSGAIYIAEDGLIKRVYK